MLMEPSADFAARLARVAEAVAEQDGARIPGQNRQPMGEIDVPDALWALVTGLAHPEAS